MSVRALATLVLGMLTVDVSLATTSRADDALVVRSTEVSNAIVDGKSDVDGVNYHYLLGRGGRQTVVLLHGWGTTSYMWRFVMPQLVARGYTVIAPDLRGLGDTAKPAAGYDKASIAEDIRKLVANLGLGPSVNLVGHDMGGMVVYAYAAQHPDDVETLAILDVPLPGIEPWDALVQGLARGISDFTPFAMFPKC